MKKFAKLEADRLSMVYSALPIPVLEIAESKGINVVFSDFGRHSETVSGLCDPNQNKIYLNCKDRHNRKTFTIAYELGHLIMNRDVADISNISILQAYRNPDISNQYNKQAYEFAKHLLVPDHFLRLLIGTSVAYLASVFSVTRHMMETRIRGV